MTGITASLVVAMSLCGQGAEAPAPDAAAPSVDVEAQVSRLLRRLDAPALADREAAEAELVGLGPDALPHLPPESATNLSAETRKRLTRIRRELEKAATERMSQATQVTLDGGPQDLAAVIAAIEQQTGNKIVDYREQFGQEALAKRIELELDKAPFWEAVDRLLDATQMDLYPFTGERNVALVERAPNGASRLGRCQYVDAFRIEPMSIQATRNLREQDGHWVDLQLEVAWEPRLSLVALRQPLANVIVKDDSGGELKFDDSEVELELSIDGQQNNGQLNLQLPPPNAAATKLSTISGTMFGLLATGEHDFRFDQLEKAKQVKQTFGDAVVTLESVRKNGAAWEVRVAIRFGEPTAALESHRGWILNNKAMLVGSDNQELTPATMENTRRTEQEIGLAYLFDLPDGPAGWTFVYRTATSIRTIPVKYELRDIDLP